MGNMAVRMRNVGAYRETAKQNSYSINVPDNFDHSGAAKKKTKCSNHIRR